MKKKLGLAISMLVLLAVGAFVSIPSEAQNQDYLTRIANIETAIWGGPKVGGGAINQTSGIATSGVITSTKATGAPIVVTSTTPATKLNAFAVAYNAAGTQQVTGHVVFGTCTLGTSCVITLAGSAAYTAANSYYCAASDQTAAAATKIVNTAAGTVTITGTSTDVIGYVCFGT